MIKIINQDLTTVHLVDSIYNLCWGSSFQSLFQFELPRGVCSEVQWANRTICVYVLIIIRVHFSCTHNSALRYRWKDLRRPGFIPYANDFHKLLLARNKFHSLQNPVYNTRSSASNNFYPQSSRLSIQLNSFSRIGPTIWIEMPLTLRNLSKYDFKRKIKRVLFDTLSSEDSYLDIRDVIQKVNVLDHVTVTPSLPSF